MKKRGSGALKLEPERSKALQSIVETVSEALGWPVSLWVVDEEKQALRIAAAVGLKAAYVREAILLLDESSVTGVCFTSGKPVDVLNVTADRRWKYTDEAEEMGWKSYLVVPVCVRGEVIGALGVYTLVERSFSPFEQQLLTDYASQVGHAVESEQRRQALRRLLEITRTMERLATEKPQAILEQVVRGARDITGADCVVLYPYDPERGDFYEIDKVASYGLHHPLTLTDKPRQAGGMAAYVKEQKEVIVENIEEERPDMLESALIARESIQAFMGIALEVADSVVGILYVNFRTPHEFPDEEKDIIRLFARQVAIAVRNARLFEQATSRAAVLQRLHQIGEQLLSVELSARGLKRVLRQVARSARRVLGADLVDVYQYVEAENRWILPPVLEGERRGPKVIKDEIFEDDVAVKVVEGGESLYSRDVQSDPLLSGPFTVERLERPDERFVVREGVLSSAAVPLKGVGETVGVMFVNYRIHQAFTSDQREIIELFANQAATAIYNARSYEQVQRRIKALEALNKVGQRLSTVEVTRRGLSRLLRQVAQQAKKVLGADLVELCQYSPGREDTVATYVSAGKRLSDIKPSKTILPDDAVARVLARGTPLFATDAQHEALLSAPFETDRENRPDQRFVIRENIASMAAIPLRVGDEVVGVLFVNYRTAQRFQAEQQELIQLFASQAAVAIRNAQLFQQRETLQRIARDITSELDRDVLLQKILERSLKLLGVEVGSIASLNRATGGLEYQYAIGKDVGMSLPVDKGLMTAAAQTQQPVRVGDVTKDPRYVEHVPKTRSEMDVPLLVGDALVGVLNAESPRYNAFSEGDERLAVALASQAAVALYNVALFEQRSALNEIAKDIASELDRDVLIQEVIERSIRLVGCKTGGVGLIDPSRNSVMFKYGGREEETLRPLPHGKGLTGRAIATGEPVRIGDVRQDKDYVPHLDSTRSELTVPLKVGREVLGVLDFQSPRLNAFDERDEELALGLAGHVAVALYNAQLFQRTQEQLEQLSALVEFGQAVTSRIRLREDEVLELIYNQASKLMDTDNMYIALYVELTNTVRFGLAVMGRRRVNVETEEEWQPRRGGKGRTEWIIHHGEPILLTTKAEAEGWYDEPGREDYLTREMLPSWLGVPMMIGEKVLGVIATYHPTREHVYSSDDLEILQAMADQAAIALDNAHMFYEVNRRLRTLVELGQEVTSGIRLREAEVLELIHRQASKLMDADNMYIALYDEATGTVRFGLAFLDSERVNVETEQGWQPRRGGKGRTEWIVHHRKPILITAQAEAEAWYAQPGHEEYTGVGIWPSWLGVPMIVGERVLGVIATYHPTREHVYSSDDLDILQAMADQAAIALDNVSKLEASQAEQERLAEAERFEYLGLLAGGVAHRVGSKGGLIRLHVDKLRNLITAEDRDAHAELEKIERDNAYLIELSEALFKPAHAAETPVGPVDVNQLLREAIRRVAIPPDVEFSCDEGDVPRIVGNRWLVDVFVELITNAIRAVAECEERRLTICSQPIDENTVTVVCEDTGCGIAREELDKVFKLFYTWGKGEEIPSRGGYGLWYSKSIVTRMGGNLQIESEVGKGTKCIVLLKVAPL